jgi:hypothetical protein
MITDEMAIGLDPLNLRTPLPFLGGMPVAYVPTGGRGPVGAPAPFSRDLKKLLPSSFGGSSPNRKYASKPRNNRCTGLS